MPHSPSSSANATPMTVIVRWAIVVVTVALFLYSTVHAMLGHRDIAVLAALATPLGISAWGFARAGHNEASVMMLSCVLITVVSLILFLNPLGVHDVAITGYAGVVVVGSLLLSRRNFVMITALTLVAAAGVFALDMTGHSHSRFARESEWVQLFGLLVVIAVFGSIGRVTSETLFGSLGAMHLAAVGDPVTGLANRRGFLAQAATLLQMARGQPSACALVLADLDGFRRLKVVVGYAATDRVLAEAARRIATVAPEHLVARIGEDEFAVLARGLADEAAAQGLARKVHEALNFDFSGVAVRCAVGFSRFPRDGDGVDALLLAAESSLLSAKAAIDGERLAGPGDRI